MTIKSRYKTAALLGAVLALGLVIFLGITNTGAVQHFSFYKMWSVSLSSEVLFSQPSALVEVIAYFSSYIIAGISISIFIEWVLTKIEKSATL